MKPVKLEQVPLLLTIFEPGLNDIGKALESYHSSSDSPQDTGIIQKNLNRYLQAKGEYLADYLDVKNFNEGLQFKRISERTANNLGRNSADFVTMQLKGQILIPPTFELLEEFIDKKETKIKIVETSGLANLRNIGGKKLESITGYFCGIPCMPNFMFPFTLQGVDISYADSEKGLNFYNRISPYQ